MTKYLKISIDGPYIGSNQTHYQPLDDDEIDDDEGHASRLQDAVWEYVDAYYDVVDESDVPEDER